jgi:surface antigen
MRVIVTAAMLALLLGACTGAPGGSRPLGSHGTVIGSDAASGAGEARLGAVEGGLLGEDIGRSLGERDRELAVQAEYEALEYGRAGQSTPWRNADSGFRGEVVVGPSYEVNRLDCREYTHTAYIDGRARVSRGTACREPGGNWRTVG